MTPRSRARVASRSSSTVPMPSPCRDSSTRKATSAESPVSPTNAVASPTTRPACTATSDQTRGPGSQITSTKSWAASRLVEKNRR